jgi:photosystem II stability/assembly factor-like uncharacterized protein
VRAALLVCALLCACGRYPTLVVVQLAGVPPGTTTLQPVVVLNGRAQALVLAAVVDRFSVQLPEGAEGDLEVRIDALVSGGCAGARGSASRAVHGEWQVDVPVELTALSPALCHLVIEKADNGEGKVTYQLDPPAAPVDCGARCELDVPQGRPVTLTAAAGVVSEFRGWSPECPGNPCTLRPVAPLRISASFTKDCPVDGWCRQSKPAGDSQLLRVWAADGQAWFTADDGVVLHSDGSWPVQWTDDTFPQVSRYGLGGTSPTDVWMVGNLGIIDHFQDGHWSSRRTGADEFANYRSVWAVSPTLAFVVGNTPGVHRWNGTSWARAVMSPSKLADVWASRTQEVWAVGDGGAIVRSKDAGLTWAAERAGLEPGFLPSLKGVWGADDQHVWAAGGFDEDDATKARGELLFFDGMQWTRVQLPAAPSFLYRIWGTGPDDVYVVGQKNTILHYGQGAWTATTVPGPAAAFSGVSGSGPDDVWVVGDRTILHRRR